MFDTERVPVLLRKLTLKIETEKDASDDEQAVRVCECTFRIPVLDYHTASRIRLPIVAHCFDRDQLPLWTVHEVAFAPPDDTYAGTLQAAPDMPIAASLELLTVLRARAFRPAKERRDLTFEFVTRHAIARGDVRDLADLINAWEGRSNLITLATVQIPLDLQPGSEAHAAAADQALPMDEPMPTPTRRRRTH